MSAQIRISTSAIRKISTLIRNAWATSENQNRNSSPLKNFSLTVGQPGDVTTSVTSAPSTTTVLSVAMAA